MPPAPLLERALLALHRRPLLVAVLVWTAIYALSGWFETRTMQMEYTRLGIATAPWEIPTWQGTSALSSLMLVALVGWAEARWPLRWGQLRRHLAFHAGLSIAYCLLHVGGMVAMREAVYAWQGANYDFGEWPRELLYEYLKDARSYALLVLVFHYSRALMRLAQGEARLLHEPDVQALATASDAERPASAPTDARHPQRFVVRKLGREFIVDADRIDAALASGNYANLHVGGAVYPLRSTMAQLEAQLDAERFLRVHRSAIVRIDAIASVSSGEGGEASVQLNSGLLVPCSRRYRSQLKDRIKG
ncbi:LytTR family DNA-binding domain-containing protein [Silanimonas algicola]